MRTYAGKIISGMLLASFSVTGAIQGADSTDSANSPRMKGEDAGASEAVSVASLLDEDSSAGQSDSELPPSPPTPQQSFSPTYRTAAQQDDTRFFQLQLGAYAGENTGVDHGYMSLEGRSGLFGDGGNSASFLDGRLLLNQYEHVGANIGAGYRRLLPGPNMVLGGNFYYDRWSTGDYGFNQVGVGVELFGGQNEFRSNVYVPLGDRTQQVGPAIGFVNGTDIFATRQLQTSLAGFDMEYGRRLLPDSGLNLKGFIGGYYYTGNQGVGDSLGIRSRSELAVGDFTQLNLSVQHDDIFETTVLFGAEFSLPGQNRGPSSASVHSRLTERVRRTQNISVAEHSKTGDTGLDAFFIQQGGTGSGAQANPYTLIDLANEGNFGAGDVAVLLGGGGTISGNIVIDDANQQVIASADGSGNATTTLVDGTILSLSGLGARPTLDGQILFNAPGRASGFDISSSTVVPIYVDGVGAGQTVTVDNVNILNSVDDGIHIVNTPGTFEFLAGTTGGLIANVPGDGIQVTGSTDVVLDNVTFQNIGMNAIRTNYTGTFIGTGTTNIINPGHNGIFLTNNNNSNFIFEDLTVVGGGNGLYLGDFTGDFTVTGDAIFRNQVSTAILHPHAAAGNVSNLSFGTLTVDHNDNSRVGFGVALESHEGTFNVDGAARIEDVVSVGLLVDQSKTDFNFGSLEINDSQGFGASFEDHTGSVEIENAFSVNKVGPLGMQIRNGQTSFEAGSVSVTNGQGIGIAVENNTGDFTVHNDVVFENLGQSGLLSQNNQGDFSFGSLSVSDTNFYGVSLNNQQGSFRVENAAEFDNTGNFGLQVLQGNVPLHFGSLSINDTNWYAMTIDRGNGDFTVDGDVSMTDVGNFGLQVVDSDTNLDFGGHLNVTGAQYVGVNVERGTGGFSVDGDVTIDGGNYGLQVLNRNGAVGFGSLTSSNNGTYGAIFNNITAPIDISGDVQFSNVGNGGWASSAMQVSNIGGPVSFGSFSAEGSGTNALEFFNNTGGLTIVDNSISSSLNGGGAANGLMSEGFSYGLHAINNSGDLTFDSVDVTGIGGQGTGLYVQGLTGGVEITGDATFANTGQNGAFFHSVSQGVDFKNLTVSGTSQSGLTLNNVQGGLDVKEDVTLTNTGSFGVSLNNVSGDANMASLDIDNANSAVRINNMSGNLNVTGDVDIDKTHQAIGLTNTTTDLNFGSLSIADATGNGLSLDNANSNVTVEGDASFNNTGSHSILSTNGSSGDFNFYGNLDVANNWSNGIGLDGHTGDFTVTEDATFDGAGAISIFAQNTKTNFSFGNLDVSGNWTNGVSLISNEGDFTVDGTANFTSTGGSAILSNQFFPGSNFSSGDFSFGELNITGNSTNGVALNGHQGAFTVEGDTTLDNTGQHGFFAAAGANTNFNIGGDLSINDNWGSSIALTEHNGEFNVEGDTSLTNVGQYGLLLQQGQGSLSFDGDLTIGGAGSSGIALWQRDGDFTVSGVTNIETPGVDGILINDHDGNWNFAELNVTNPGNNGVSLSLFDGSFTSTGGTISGITSGNQAIFKHDSGSGHITLEDMIFTSNANDVFGLVTLEYGSGGSATLNNNQVQFADGSTGTIGYRFGSFDLNNKVQLDGTGNTTSNAVESTQFDTFAPSFDGTVEIDGVDEPQP